MVKSNERFSLVEEAANDGVLTTVLGAERLAGADLGSFGGGNPRRVERRQRNRGRIERQRR